ncbi:hypothetical protein ACMT4L_19230 [Deinococcus sp. A31D244]|uniref:hypothetical protein n=1 Tax=Deinococcus sp. A31D244 TaxID=3397675 RepID=UPI0039E03858
MNKHAVEQEATRFIRKFLNKEFACWQLAYQELDRAKYEAAVTGFVREFFTFEAVPSITRPRNVSAGWLEEAKEYLAATIERPLFKIEQYLVGDEPVYAAYTGSNDLGSDSYAEVFLYGNRSGQHRIFSVFHSDPDGGIEHFDGEEFSFSRARLVAIEKFLAPADEADLLDYQLEPV